MALEWLDLAKCREVGVAAFFPEPCDNRQVQRAKEVCGVCYVQAECLEFGLYETHGIWGGTTEHERRLLRRRRNRKKAIA